MAIGQFAIRLQQRSKGHTATAGVAYRCGMDLRDERSGKLHRYSNREHSQTVGATGLIEGGQTFELDEQRAARFCAWVESRERRRDAVIGRDFQGALPHELPAELRPKAVHRFGGFLCARYRTPLIYAIHGPERHHDQRNHHAHFWVPARDVDGKKLNILNLATGGREEVQLVRDVWELVVNDVLAEAGLEPSVNTGKNVNGDPEPTLGAEATARERAHRWQLEKQGEGAFPIGASVSEMCADGRSVTFEGHKLEHHRLRRVQREAAAQKPPRKRRRRMRTAPAADAQTEGPRRRKTPHAQRRSGPGERVLGPETMATGDDETQTGTAQQTHWSGPVSSEDRAKENIAEAIMALLSAGEIKTTRGRPEPRTVLRRSQGRVARRATRPRAIQQLGVAGATQALHTLKDGIVGARRRRIAILRRKIQERNARAAQDAERKRRAETAERTARATAAQEVERQAREKAAQETERKAREHAEQEAKREATARAAQEAERRRRAEAAERAAVTRAAQEIERKARERAAQETERKAQRQAAQEAKREAAARAAAEAEEAIRADERAAYIARYGEPPPDDRGPQEEPRGEAEELRKDVAREGTESASTPPAEPQDAFEADQREAWEAKYGRDKKTWMRDFAREAARARLLEAGGAGRAGDFLPQGRGPFASKKARLAAAGRLDEILERIRNHKLPTGRNTTVSAWWVQNWNELEEKIVDEMVDLAQRVEEREKARKALFSGKRPRK